MRGAEQKGEPSREYAFEVSEEELSREIVLKVIIDGGDTVRWKTVPAKWPLGRALGIMGFTPSHYQWYNNLKLVQRGQILASVSKDDHISITGHPA